MKLRCLLVDDEPPALKVLESYIAQMNGLDIIGQCKNALEALDVLSSKPVDVMFLDINMPKLLGTDLLKNLSHPPKVIFVSAYSDYALVGYELDVVDFLVKPVSFERFVKSITKVKRMMGQESISQCAPGKSIAEPFIYLRVERNMQKVFIDDILYIESWKEYIKVFLTTGKILLIKQSISLTENILSDHEFVRVHRSYLVSLNKISGYNAVLVRVGTTEIPIGRLYKQAVMDVLQEN